MGADVVILDESHYIKNPKSQRSKLASVIARSARRVLALTGTPIANRPVELWPVLQLVAPEEFDPAGRLRGQTVGAGEGAGFFRFAKQYCDAHKNEYAWDFSGHSNTSELQTRLRATCMVRRLKSEVLAELPAKRRQVVELDVDGSKFTLDAEYTAAVADLAFDGGVDFTTLAATRHEDALTKLPLAVEHLEECLSAGRKVVVFAHHHDVVDALETALSAHGVVTLTGETAMPARQAAVDAFQTDPSVQVFIGSITAAGVGLTLTAASHVVFVELDWVPANVQQAEDRCHRIGQTESVLVQHLVLAGSLDARMAQVLVQKMDVADAALDRRVVTPERTDRPAPKAGSPAAPELSDEEIAKIHAQLQTLAERCDGARAQDGAGFNRLDTGIGCALAMCATLTQSQAALGARIVRKYRKQLGAA